jgi:hypothetical protein
MKKLNGKRSTEEINTVKDVKCGSRKIYLGLHALKVSVRKFTAPTLWTFTGPTDTCSCSSNLVMREKCGLLAVPGTVPV